MHAHTFTQAHLHIQTNPHSQSRARAQSNVKTNQSNSVRMHNSLCQQGHLTPLTGGLGSGTLREDRDAVIFGTKSWPTKAEIGDMVPPATMTARQSLSTSAKCEPGLRSRNLIDELGGTWIVVFTFQWARKRLFAIRLKECTHTNVRMYTLKNVTWGVQKYAYACMHSKKTSACVAYVHTCACVCMCV